LGLDFIFQQDTIKRLLFLHSHTNSLGLRISMAG
jgi:hypothetical protein